MEFLMEKNIVLFYYSNLRIILGAISRLMKNMFSYYKDNYEKLEKEFIDFINYKINDVIASIMIVIDNKKYIITGVGLSDSPVYTSYITDRIYNGTSLILGSWENLVKEITYVGLGLYLINSKEHEISPYVYSDYMQNHPNFTKDGVEALALYLFIVFYYEKFNKDKIKIVDKMRNFDGFLSTTMGLSL